MAIFSVFLVLSMLLSIGLHSNQGAEVTCYDDPVDETTLVLEQLVSEAEKTADALIDKALEQIDKRKELYRDAVTLRVGTVFFYRKCLEHLPKWKEITKTTITEALESPNEEGRKKVVPQQKDHEKNEVKKKLLLQPMCEKVFEELRTNPWRSVEELCGRRKELLATAEQHAKLIKEFK